MPPLYPEGGTMNHPLPSIYTFGIVRLPVRIGRVSSVFAVLPENISFARRSIDPVILFRNVPESSFARIRGINGGMIVTEIVVLLQLDGFVCSQISYERR